MINVPPTPEDAKLRIKHVADSVKYNLRHAHDHSMAVADQLHKLRAVSPSRAQKQATQAQKELDKTVAKFKRGMHGAISAHNLDQSSAKQTTKGY